MKKKLIIIISIIVLIVIGLAIYLGIKSIYKDKTDIAKDIETINNNYELVKKEIENYNTTRLQVADIINEF